MSPSIATGSSTYCLCRYHNGIVSIRAAHTGSASARARAPLEIDDPIPKPRAIQNSLDIKGSLIIAPPRAPLWLSLAAFELALDGGSDEVGFDLAFGQDVGNAFECPLRELRQHRFMP